MNDIEHQSRLEAETMRKVTWRIIPFLIVCYLLALIDRGNIGMAALQMNDDLGISKKVFGFAGSLFFFAYFLFEVPSNLALQKYGARKWIARIMITWGMVSAGTAFVQGQNSLFFMRFLLGAAEAGFFPGVGAVLDLLVPGRLSRPHHRDLHGGGADGRFHRLAAVGPAAPGRWPVRHARLALAVHS
jgi:MFS family permease